jgi:hypothetical protein
VTPDHLCKLLNDYVSLSHQRYAPPLADGGGTTLIGSGSWSLLPRAPRQPAPQPPPPQDLRRIIASSSTIDAISPFDGSSRGKRFQNQLQATMKYTLRARTRGGKLGTSYVRPPPSSVINLEGEGDEEGEEKREEGAQKQLSSYVSRERKMQNVPGRSMTQLLFPPFKFLRNLHSFQ